MFFATPAWDMTLFRLINDVWRYPILDYLAPLFSYTAFLILLVCCFVCIGLRCYGSKKILATLFLIMTTVLIINAGTDILKDMHGRLRPNQSLPLTHFIKEDDWTQREHDYRPVKKQSTSYPSSHAANSMAAAVIIAFFWPASRGLIWLLPLLVGWSRIYLGKHFPTDVLFAYGWGASIALTGLLVVLYIPFFCKYLPGRKQD